MRCCACFLQIILMGVSILNYAVKATQGPQNRFFLLYLSFQFSIFCHLNLGQLLSARRMRMYNCMYLFAFLSFPPSFSLFSLSISLSLFLSLSLSTSLFFSSELGIVTLCKQNEDAHLSISLHLSFPSSFQVCLRLSLISLSLHLFFSSVLGTITQCKHADPELQDVFHLTSDSWKFLWMGEAGGDMRRETHRVRKNTSTAHSHRGISY